MPVFAKKAEIFFEKDSKKLYKSVYRPSQFDKVISLVYNNSRSTGMVLLIKRPHPNSFFFLSQCLHLLSAVSFVFPPEGVTKIEMPTLGHCRDRELSFAQSRLHILGS